MYWLLMKAKMDKAINKEAFVNEISVETYICTYPVDIQDLLWHRVFLNVPLDLNLWYLQQTVILKMPRKAWSQYSNCVQSNGEYSRRLDQTHRRSLLTT